MKALPPANKAASLRRLMAHHPYISVLALTIIFLLVAELLALILRWMQLPFLSAILIRESLLVIVIAVLITIPGWWSEAGFTRGFDRHTPIICLGAIILIGLPLLALPVLLTGESPSSLTVVMAIAVALLVGVVEEGLFRGLMGCILLPEGILVYVILSSMLFAAVHLANLLSGLPLSYVIAQMILALGSGILFAAIRLRTGSIWPTILLHAVHDVVGLLLLAIDPKRALAGSLNLNIIASSIFCLLFIINAAILLRPGKLRRLRINYGLTPQTPMLPVNEEQIKPF
jgi:membrane protease YdiL (CAAX protease family)